MSTAGPVGLSNAVTRRNTRILIGLLVVTTASMGFLALDRAHWPGMVACGFVAGSLLVWLWRIGEISTRYVLMVAILLRLFVVWLPPTLSDDFYRYLWDGVVQLDGINPYRFTPDDPSLAAYQEEEIFAYLNSSAYYSAYPPISQFLFVIAALFYQQGWIVSYYVLKILFLLMEVGGIFVLSRIAEARSLMLYAWHPLVIMVVAGQVHTESALVLFLAMMLQYARRERGALAAAALAAAGLVKLYPFVLAPLLLHRFGRRSVIVIGLITGLFALPFAAPYVLPHVSTSLELYVRLFEFNAGFYYALKEIFRIATDDDWSKTLGPALQVFFLAILPVFYFIDWRFRWSLERTTMWLLGLFFVLATTVHPWYLLAVLPLVALSATPSWHWYWLSLCTLGTYLLYVPGWQDAYWLFVMAGWGGWLLLAILKHADDALQVLQRLRAKQKLSFIRPYLPMKHPLRVLDLGAGEGYVGAAMVRELQAEVVLADVVEMNRTVLPIVIYDGHVLPFESDTFDVTLLYFVLHHTEQAEQVLREGMRVAQDRILVVESIYEKPWERKLLTVLDTIANRIRSGGLMRTQEEHLSFRTAPEWQTLFNELGLTVIATRRTGWFIHRQILFALSAVR